MSSDWGRIDAGGTVYVRTADGEREIGSWQAGDADAGLAFYQRRFEDLETEVDLLEKRLASGAGDPNSTRTKAGALREQLPTAAAIGDLDGLVRRLDTLLEAVAAKAAEANAAREQARSDAVAAKEALIAESEKIAEAGTAWKSSGDRLRAIVEEWKLIKGIDRKTDDALWKRFSSARDAFGRRRGQHFAQLDAERGTAKQIKEDLAERAEALAESSDWKETAAAMRGLMTEWKASPRAARDVEEALWKRFRAAQDLFFSRRSGVFAERDAEQVANLATKEAVIAQAEALSLDDPKAAQAALRELQARFDQAGHVPRDAMRRIDDRMRAAEQRVRDAAEAQWRQGSVASNPFLSAMRERLAEAEAKLERARKSGDEARIAKAEAEVEQRRSLLPT
jgi:FtsZ-binding cell division protein ZapB